jgi:3-hydroxybutyryl-CoA dehydrogenase
MGNIRNNLQKYFVEKGKMSQEQADQTLARLTTTTDLKTGVSDADLVIEAIPEVLSLKQKVFQELDGICPDHTILASNTSSLSIDDIGLYAKRKAKILVTHFINPVQRMKLIELVISNLTSQETLNQVKGFAQSIGKETVLVKNSPGFVTTRIFVTLVNEAAKMLDEGIATAEDIDKAIVLGLNHPIGPLQAGDINIETLVHCLRYLKETLGESYAPSPLLEKMLAEGKLGVKSGQGFYTYNRM